MRRSTGRAGATSRWSACSELPLLAPADLDRELVDVTELVAEALVAAHARIGAR